VQELIAGPQIIHNEAKGRAADALLDALGRNKNSAVYVLGHANVAVLLARHGVNWRAAACSSTLQQKKS
jgi:hypothetical protein